MADVFDQLHASGPAAQPPPSSTPSGSGDIFDQLHSQAQPQGESKQPQPQSDAWSMEGIGRSLKNQAKGLFDTISSVVSPFEPGADPHIAAQRQDAMMQASADQWQKAKDAAAKGNHFEAVHRALAAFPVLGPMIQGEIDKWNSGAPGSKAEVATDIATPIATAGAVKGAAKLANAGAEPLYQSALKPGVADAPTLEDASAQVHTGLQNQIPVTPAGVSRLRGLVSDYAQKVNDAVQQADQAGETVDPNLVARRVQGVRDRFQSQVAPSKDLKAIDATKNEFLQNQGARPFQPGQPGQPAQVGIGPNGQPVMTPATPGTPAVNARPAQPMPVGQAQAMKTGTYQQIKAKFGEMSSAQVEAEKALALGLKEELENRIPELKGLNEQEGKLLDLQGSLERAVRRSGNHDIVGLGDATATAAGGVAGGVPGAAAAGFLKKILDMPGVKSKIAIALNKATGKSGPAIGLATALGRVGDAFDGIVNDQHDSDENVKYKPGDMVRLNDGRAVTVRKVNPDGTFEHD